MNLVTTHPGISIIVVSYRRMNALYTNLTSLLDQELRGIPYEIIVFNNSHQVQLKPSRWSKLGRLFRACPEIKLVNSQCNWLSVIRFGMVYMARYDTVLVLDDDLHLLDANVVYDMYQTLMDLGDYDIVSSWNTIWTQWNDSEIQWVSATMWNPELTQLIKTDTCGSGISMFNKILIFHAFAQRHLIIPGLPSGDMALGLLSNFLWGGTTYAMPLYNRATFHEEHTQHALHKRKDSRPNRFRLYKEMLKSGYQPVITREKGGDSPEMQLIRTQTPSIERW